jgi:hypothetical protein
MENDEVRNKKYAQLLKLPRSRSREYVENPTALPKQDIKVYIQRALCFYVF